MSSNLQKSSGLKIIISAILFYTFIIINGSASAQENKYAAGIKVHSSSGMTDSYIYYQPYISAKIYLDQFTLSPIAARLQDYQLTDGNGNYEYVNINKAGTSLAYDFNDNIELSGGYYYNSGGSSYFLHDLFGEIFYDTEKYGLTGGYTRRNSGYTVNLADIKETASIINFEYSYYPDDRSSLDLSYEYKYTAVTGTSDYFTVDTIRGGYSTLLSDTSSILAGINIGKDSADNTILGIDAGVAVKMFDHLKITVFYLGSYSSPDLFAVKQNDVKGGGKTSPFMDPSKTGEAVISHIVSAGAEIYF
jgi:hypothetical protein